jgi:DNA-directed RNA polymerase specialized sigma24 family protein
MTQPTAHDRLAARRADVATAHDRLTAATRAYYTELVASPLSLRQIAAVLGTTKAGAQSAVTRARAAAYTKENPR